MWGIKIPQKVRLCLEVNQGWRKVLMNLSLLELGGG